MSRDIGDAPGFFGQVPGGQSLPTYAMRSGTWAKRATDVVNEVPRWSTTTPPSGLELLPRLVQREALSCDTGGRVLRKSPSRCSLAPYAAAVSKNRMPSSSARGSSSCVSSPDRARSGVAPWALDGDQVHSELSVAHRNAPALMWCSTIGHQWRTASSECASSRLSHEPSQAGSAASVGTNTGTWARGVGYG